MDVCDDESWTPKGESATGASSTLNTEGRVGKDLVQSMSSCRLTLRFSGGPRSGPSAATGCWASHIRNVDSELGFYRSGQRRLVERRKIDNFRDDTDVFPAALSIEKAAVRGGADLGGNGI